jgi:hypothetical protein
MNVRTSITAEQKRRRFRELARHDLRICRGNQFAAEFEQPLLPFNEFKTRVRQENHAGAFPVGPQKHERENT